MWWKKRILLPFLLAVAFTAVTAQHAAAVVQEHVLIATQKEILQEALARGDGHYEYVTDSDPEVIACVLNLPRVRSWDSFISVGTQAVYIQDDGDPCRVAVRMKIHALSWRPPTIPRVVGCIIRAKDLETHRVRFEGAGQSVSSVSGSKLLSLFRGCNVTVEVNVSYQLLKPLPWVDMEQPRRFEQKNICSKGVGREKHRVPCSSVLR